MVTANPELTYNSKIEGYIFVNRVDAAIKWVHTN